ncbi:MAG TPA: TIGR03621 family F420-dependent LLM class oxidoreductase [Roseiflexaceae bacterium]|nr:TIGR03621 family F420-dependent LLM class oxidoreductase [Roseiflexaceae bacterium]
MNKKRHFRFGVINEQVLSAERWIAHVRRVEAEGYSTFLIRDHFVPDYFGDQLAPIAALMAAAGATQTLRVGSLVFDNDYRHPVILAKEAATIDLLSGGRLELGLGAGWLRAEYEQAGLAFDPPGVRISRLEEAIRVIKGLFADEPLNFAGRHYTIATLKGVPQPVQRPHPPILIGAGQKRMLTLAGREADIVGILTTSVASGTLAADSTERLAEAVAQKVEWVRQGAGARFGDLELSLVPTIILTEQRRRRTEQYVRENRWQGISVEQVWEMPAVFVGSVDQIVEDMQARRERYGFSYFVVSDCEMAAAAPIVARLADT